MDIFIDKGDLHLVGEVIIGDYEKLINKAKCLQTNLEDNYRVYLKTQGGSITEASKIMIFFLKRPFVDVVACEYVHSSGIIIYLGFRARRAQENTKFLFHFPIFENDISTIDQEKKILQIQSFFAERLNKNIDFINLLMKENRILNERDAIHYELCHDVIKATE